MHFATPLQEETHAHSSTVGCHFFIYVILLIMFTLETYSTIETNIQKRKLQNLKVWTFLDIFVIGICMWQQFFLK